MAKETAEEKLLKMLQKSGSPVAASVKSPVVSKPKRSFALSIRFINQILLLGIIVCIAALVWQMREGVALLNQEVDLSGESYASAKIVDMALPSAKPAEYYLGNVQNRNIFRPYEPPSPTKTPSALDLTKRLSKYRLVGVAWLDLPESASIMLEDSVTKQTYFLKQGEQLEGVTVKTIYTDRAVFSYENEETTIKL